MPRPRERSTLLKSVPRAPGRDRARQGDRSRPDRGLVRGRGPDRAEEQDHPALGTTGTRPSAPHDQRTASTYIFGAICPGDGKGAALVLPACNTEAMNLHLAEIAAEVAPGKARRARRRPSRMAPLGSPRGSGQHHARGAPAQMPGAQPRRERLAVLASVMGPSLSIPNLAAGYLLPSVVGALAAT